MTRARDDEGAACRVLWTVPRLAAGPWRVVAIVGAPQAAALEAGAGQSLPALAELISRPGEAQVVALPGATSRTTDPSGGHD